MLNEYKRLTSKLLQDEYVRYSKQIILKQIGIEGQKKLRKTKILVIGAGGLGCTTMLYLVIAGVGSIGIIDKDIIEESNLNRQILYNKKKIGKSKVECAKEELKLINTRTQIITHNWKINSSNSLEIISYYDIIIDATDNFNTRKVIDDACHKLHKTYIYGAVDEFEGEVAILNYKNGLRYRHLYKSYSEVLEDTCNRNGIMGISTGYIGILQAIETIKLILGLDKQCKNTIIRHNLLTATTQKNLINPNRNSLDKQATNKSQEKDIANTMNIEKNNNIIIDLRERNEFNRQHTNRAINIPVKKFNLAQTKILIMNYAKNKKVIIQCNEKNKSIAVSRILNEYKIPHRIDTRTT